MDPVSAVEAAKLISVAVQTGVKSSDSDLPTGGTQEFPKSEKRPLQSLNPFSEDGVKVSGVFNSPKLKFDPLFASCSTIFQTHPLDNN